MRTRTDTSMTRWGPLVWMGAALGLGLLLTACTPTDAPSPPPSPTEPEVGGPGFRNVNTEVAYVGDATCATCHEDLYNTYQAHGMARSFYRLTPDNAVEDFSGVTLHHEPTGFYYTMYEDEGRYVQEEYRLDSDGEKTHQLVREMVYVVGSGNAARTYLTEQNGRLYEMPVTWYTQGQRWDFSPGYNIGNKRFDRLVPDRCMACHNSTPVAVPFTDGKYDTVPLGIGCEKCHGPGDLHVEERLADPEGGGDLDLTIVNPEHLTLDRRLDVCQQCHLSATVSVLRAGRGAYDFRPAEALADHIALFAQAGVESQEAIDVISHADRMKQSACFIETQAQGQPLECVSCHNPHEGFRDKGPDYFNTTCQSCHAPADLEAQLRTPEALASHTPEANCIACHMPKVQGEGTPHTSFTDHWTRVVERDGAPQPLVAHTQADLEPYFDRDLDGEGAAPVYEGMAYVVYGEQNGDTEAMREGIRRLEAALVEHPGHSEGHYILGYTHLQLGNAEAAIPALEAAVRLDAAIPERLNTLAQAYEAARRDPATITRLYQQALRLQPALADIRLNYGRFLETQSRLPEAMRQYQLAIDEAPWLALAHYNLGTGYLQMQDFAAAEAALRAAVRLQPIYPEALSNLGLMYAVQDQPEEARTWFEQAVDVAPGNAVALGNLGAFYLNTGAIDDAITMLTRAVEVDPQYVDALANLAQAHVNNDELILARDYAQRALQINPNHPLARQILAVL